MVQIAVNIALRAGSIRQSIRCREASISPQIRDSSRWMALATIPI
jgi:hypothetical protein